MPLFHSGGGSVYRDALAADPHTIKVPYPRCLPGVRCLDSWCGMVRTW